MKKIAITFGAVLGLAMLGGCVSPYDSYDTGGYAYGPYDNGPTRYDTYYGPDYYAGSPYYRGGDYRAYNPGRGHDGRGDYRRGDRDGNNYRRDGARSNDMRPDGGRRDGQAYQQQQRPQQQQQASQPPRTFDSPRTQMFGRAAANPAPPPAPAPAYAPPPSPPQSSGWNGFQGRNPNDPNNTD